MELIIYFFFYSFLGWCLEVSYYFYKKREFVNRGFYNGPIVPIYGVSMILLHIIISNTIGINSINNIQGFFFVFIMITVISTLLELIGGAVLFNLFETRWWDYSEEKYNYKGYISLKFSLIWGFMGVLAFNVLHINLVIPTLELLSNTMALIISMVFLFVFIVDAFFTMKSLIEFKVLMQEAKERLDLFEKQSHVLLYNLSTKAPSSLRNYLGEFTNTIKQNSKLIKIKQTLGNLKPDIHLKEAPDEKEFSRIDSLIDKITSTRLYKAFPELKLKIKNRRSDHDGK